MNENEIDQLEIRSLISQVLLATPSTVRPIRWECYCLWPTQHLLHKFHDLRLPLHHEKIDKFSTLFRAPFIWKITIGPNPEKLVHACVKIKCQLPFQFIFRIFEFLFHIISTRYASIKLTILLLTLGSNFIRQKKFQAILSLFTFCNEYSLGLSSSRWSIVYILYYNIHSSVN
jgi:hypothetical protein